MSAIVFIPLTQGKVAVIDFDDFEKVRPHKWYADRGSRRGGFYAARSIYELGKKRTLLLHQLIMGPTPIGLEIGHKDGNGLNCRRRNLHFLTHKQNLQGPIRRGPKACSTFRGVSRGKNNKKWRARIRPDGGALHIGYFEREEDAARAYDIKARELFGEWASTNFPL